MPIGKVKDTLRKVYTPLMTVSEAEVLLRFHENFVMASLRRLEAMGTETDEAGKKPPS
jgi:hypothetical protein